MQREIEDQIYDAFFVIMNFITKAIAEDLFSSVGATNLFITLKHTSRSLTRGS